MQGAQALSNTFDRFNSDTWKVADDIGENVAPWITDLVDQLLSNGACSHQSSGTRRLGQDETTIGRAINDWEPDIVPEWLNHKIMNDKNQITQHSNFRHKQLQQ